MRYLFRYISGLIKPRKNKIIVTTLERVVVVVVGKFDVSFEAVSDVKWFNAWRKITHKKEAHCRIFQPREQET